MLSLFKVFMSDEAIANSTKTLASGYITEGDKVKQFEQQLEDFIGTKVLTVNSATSGLTLCFKLLMQPDPNVNWPGFDVDRDVVLATPLTCTASNWSALANNCNLKWVDVDTETAMMSLSDLCAKLSNTTKIILLTHWGGVPIDLEALDLILDDFVEEHGFRPRVIEDCAHAFGAEYQDRRVGNYGNLAVFSFQAIKHLTTVDGGCICFPEHCKKLYQRAKKLRWFGIDRDNRGVADGDFRQEDDIGEFGYKYHMNDVNASIGLGNLPHIPRLLKVCRRNAALYRELLREHQDKIQLLEVVDDSNPSHWLFSVRVLGVDKPKLIKHMHDSDIMVSQVHKRNDVHSCVREFQDSNLPNMDVLCRELICLPCGWWITEENVRFIVARLVEFLSQRSSYKTRNDLDYGDLLRALVIGKPKLSVEFGILDGFSTRILAEHSAQVKAYDIFDDFNGYNKSTSIDKLNLPPNVDVQYGDLFDTTIVDQFDDDSVDVLHIDIANDGDVVEYVMQTWQTKVRGQIIFEGGSRARDDVPWMKRYNKKPMHEVLQDFEGKGWVVNFFGKLPSLTVVSKTQRKDFIA